MKLKILRNENNISQYKISQDLNISLRSYQEYESERTELKASQLVKIADYFDVSLDYLCDRQYKNNLPIDGLTKKQLELMQKVRSLSDEDVDRVIGYIGRLKEEPFENIIEKIKRSWCNMKTKINELVRSSGKTQQEMANYLGISQASFYSYTVGKAEPSLDKLIKIADYFDVSLDYLCDRQYKNNLPVDGLTRAQLDLMKSIRALSDDDVYRVIGYVGRLKEEPFEKTIEKIKRS